MIDEHSKKLEQAWQKATAEIYKATQQAKEQPKSEPTQESKPNTEETEADEVEFEEVKK